MHCAWCQSTTGHGHELQLPVLTCSTHLIQVWPWTFGSRSNRRRLCRAEFRLLVLTCVAIEKAWCLAKHGPKDAGILVGESDAAFCQPRGDTFLPRLADAEPTARMGSLSLSADRKADRSWIRRPQLSLSGPLSSERYIVASVSDPLQGWSSRRWNSASGRVSPSQGRRTVPRCGTA